VKMESEIANWTLISIFEDIDYVEDQYHHDCDCDLLIEPQDFED